MSKWYNMLHKPAKQQHEALCHDHGADSVCTVPFSEGDRFLGALVMERPDGQPFDRDTVARDDVAEVFDFRLPKGTFAGLAIEAVLS